MVHHINYQVELVQRACLEHVLPLCSPPQDIYVPMDLELRFLSSVQTKDFKLHSRASAPGLPFDILMNQLCGYVFCPLTPKCRVCSKVACCCAQIKLFCLPFPFWSSPSVLCVVSLALLKLNCCRIFLFSFHTPQSALKDSILWPCKTQSQLLTLIALPSQCRCRRIRGMLPAVSPQLA